MTTEPNLQPERNTPMQTASAAPESQHSADSIAGFPTLAITRIRGAQYLNRVTIYLMMLALAIFLIFGTVASLKTFNDNYSVYVLFHYLPYALVALAIPLLLYQAFVVSRYRLCQPSMLMISVGGGLLLLVVCLVFALSNWLWLAMASWIGVAYWFQATFKRFFTFISAQEQVKDNQSLR